MKVTGSNWVFLMRKHFILQVLTQTMQVEQNVE